MTFAQGSLMPAPLIQETSFFRDTGVFQALRTVILPQLIAQRRHTRQLRIWSAACATGQELYSVAMLLREHFPEVAETWDVSLLGTDISAAAVEYAARARYRKLEVNRGLPARMLLRYFVRAGEAWEVGPEARGLCRFRTENLCDPRTAPGESDLILLRNVLLYFTQAQRRSVLAHMHRGMARDGVLLLGAAEQAEDSSDVFRAEFAGECYFYRSVAASRTHAAENSRERIQ